VNQADQILSQSVDDNGNPCTEIITRSVSNGNYSNKMAEVSLTFSNFTTGTYKAFVPGQYVDNVNLAVSGTCGSATLPTETGPWGPQFGLFPNGVALPMTVSTLSGSTTFQAMGLASGGLAEWTVGWTLVPNGCDLPTGETTAFSGWDATGLFNGAPNPTIGKWKQALTSSSGVNFSGRTVQEASGGGGVDTCWFVGSAFLPFNSISGGTWTVNTDNTWGTGSGGAGYDFVGWTAAMVTYYRMNGRAPCGTTFKQQMTMQCPDGSFSNYGSVNTLGGSFTATTVTSIRAGGTATRRY
jgi:hypothetical protein